MPQASNPASSRLKIPSTSSSSPSATSMRSSPCPSVPDHNPELNLFTRVRSSPLTISSALMGRPWSASVGPRIALAAWLKRAPPRAVPAARGRGPLAPGLACPVAARGGIRGGSVIPSSSGRRRSVILLRQPEEKRHPPPAGRSRSVHLGERKVRDGTASRLSIVACRRRCAALLCSMDQNLPD